MHFRNIHGVEESILIGNDPPATVELLEDNCERWDRLIVRWKPETPWDKANQRSLRQLRKRRTAQLKALHRLEVKEKELKRQKEKELIKNLVNFIDIEL